MGVRMAAVAVLILISLTALSNSVAVGGGGQNETKVAPPKIDFTRYITYEELNATLQTFQSYYSDILSVEVIGKTWGWNATSGAYDTPRDIYVVKISDNVGVEENEPGIFINWHHAREWLGPMLILYLMQSLVENYTTNDTIHWIVDHFQIYLVPMTNADGYVFDGDGNRSQVVGSGWRKNCRDNDGSGSLDTYVDFWGDIHGEGVDFERNWDWDWASGDSNPDSDTYHGPAPFSEPETQAERDFILNHSINAYMVVHSFHGSVLIPWGNASANTPHDAFYRSLASNITKRTMIEGSPTSTYQYGRPDEVIGYTAPGGSFDWVYGVHNIIGIAVELEPTWSNAPDAFTGFHPDETKILTYIHDFYEGLMYFIEASDVTLTPKEQGAAQPLPYIIYGHVTDSTGAPLAGENVTVEVLSNGLTLNVTTDVNGFYMVNLANVRHVIGDTVRISAAGVSQDITVDSAGRKEVNLVSGVVPEVNPTMVVVLLAFMAVLIRRL